MTKRRRILLVLFTIIVCVAGDQITKAMAGSYLPKKKSLSFAGDMLRLDFAVNKGAVLSFEPYLPEKWQGPAFTAAAAFLIAAFIIFLLLTTSFNKYSSAALSLFCGGSLSNIYDRITAGSVIDFLNVGWGAYRTSIFNVADIAITAGLFLFILGILSKVLLHAYRILRRTVRTDC